MNEEVEWGSNQIERESIWQYTCSRNRVCEEKSLCCWLRLGRHREERNNVVLGATEMRDRKKLQEDENFKHRDVERLRQRMCVWAEKWNDEEEGVQAEKPRSNEGFVGDIYVWMDIAHCTLHMLSRQDQAKRERKKDALK